MTPSSKSVSDVVCSRCGQQICDGCHTDIHLNDTTEEKCINCHGSCQPQQETTALTISTGLEDQNLQRRIQRVSPCSNCGTSEGKALFVIRHVSRNCSHSLCFECSKLINFAETVPECDHAFADSQCEHTCPTIPSICDDLEEEVKK